MQAGARHRAVIALVVTAYLTGASAAQTTTILPHDTSSGLAPSGAAPAIVATPPSIPPAAADANRLDTPGETLKKAGAVIRDLASGNVHALRRGPLLLHGNFCGIGGRPGLAPIDALDAACKRHDACTRTGSLPNCTCDERLEREATAIAGDPATTAELKALAAATAASMAVLICK